MTFLGIAKQGEDIHHAEFDNWDDLHDWAEEQRSCMAGNNEEWAIHVKECYAVADELFEPMDTEEAWMYACSEEVEVTHGK